MARKRIEAKRRAEFLLTVTPGGKLIVPGYRPFLVEGMTRLKGGGIYPKLKLK